LSYRGAFASRRLYPLLLAQIRLGCVSKTRLRRTGYCIGCFGGYKSGGEPVEKGCGNNSWR